MSIFLDVTMAHLCTLCSLSHFITHEETDSMFNYFCSTVEPLICDSLIGKYCDAYKAG